MAVLRKEKRKHYTVIDNGIFKDYSLSYKAKGLLCQMLSLPDGWEYSVKGLMTLASDRYSAITSGLAELEKAGYFRREQVFDGNKFAGYEYVISETPHFDFPCSENPKSEIPKSEIPISENQAQLNTKELNTNKSNTKDIYISEFENLWKLYPRKQGKENALKDYIKARKSGVSYQEIEDGIKAYVNYINVTKTETQYIKHGSTFFHQKSWKDDWTVDAGYSTASTKESFEEMMARL